jgi:DNA-directed RNA polymerase specialized sigma24 family protein
MELLEKTIDVSAASREKFFEALYETTFPAFARFAARMNASFEDAKDIFHDALIIYYEKSMDADFVPQTKPEAYILGIAKHLWIRKFKDDAYRISLDSLESRIIPPEDYFPTVNETRLLGFLELSGKKCLDLLRKFYYEKIALKHIAAALGYSSVHSATVQKFKCIGKIREAIKSHSANYEDFVS